MKHAAMVAFIAVVAVAGVVVGLQRTVVDGHVLAADILPAIRQSNPHVREVDCDPEIPIDRDGATFHCTFVGDDGSRATFHYAMDREGGLRQIPEAP